MRERRARDTVTSVGGPVVRSRLTGRTPPGPGRRRATGGAGTESVRSALGEAQDRELGAGAVGARLGGQELRLLVREALQFLLDPLGGTLEGEAVQVEAGEVDRFVVVRAAL